MRPPALAYLALITLNQLLPSVEFARLPRPTQHWVQTVTILSGGFIVTSLLWAAALALLIDVRIRAAAATLLLAAVFSWFGIIHSPLPAGPIVRPSVAMSRLREQGRAEVSAHQTPYHWAGAYTAAAAVFLAVGALGCPPSVSKPSADDLDDPLAGCEIK